MIRRVTVVTDVTAYTELKPPFFWEVPLHPVPFPRPHKPAKGVNKRSQSVEKEVEKPGRRMRKSRARVTSF